MILRRRSIGEQDAVLTVLSDDLGIIDVFAHGVKKPKSKLAAALQPFYYSEMTLYCTRDRYTVNRASAIETFHDLRYDVEKVAIAEYIGELIQNLSPTEDLIDPVRRLCLNTYYLLAKGKLPAEFIKSVCELRLMSISGFMPDLVCCHECHAFENVRLYFHPEQGNLTCENCLEDFDKSSFFMLSTSLLQALRHIIYSEDEKIFRFTASETTLCQLYQITERYVIYHIDRSFRSLELYHSLVEGRTVHP